MAGGAVRRINDKFYFVLDEVGESSENESEQASDIDSKGKFERNKKSKISDENVGSETPAFKNHLLNTVTNDKNYDREDSKDSINSMANTLTNNSSSRDVERKRDKMIKKLSECRNKNTNYINKNRSDSNLDSEESSAVIDMEIDSDIEATEPKIQPLIRITFRDESVEKLLKTSLENFFSQKIKNCSIVKNCENNLELEVYDKVLLNDEILDFDLDTTPGDNHSDIPCYGKKHDFILSDKSSNDLESEKTQSASTVRCFNCMGKHNLRDCPKPRDYKSIKKNKLTFQNQNIINKSSRYHLDENQKFSHIRPGMISKKLRQALNLHRDQQPAFIYRMRILGYPPAWLEEAKISHSGVAMYDSKGVAVLEEDEEEGEILPEGAKDRYDITKIIDFPGFNVPLPKNFKDETKLHVCPDMSEEQSKETLIRQLEPKTAQAYIKKSLSNQKLDDKPSQEDATSTMEELEEKKRQLLLQLNNEDSVSETKLNSDDSSSITNTEPKQESIFNSESKEFGRVKNLELGTPILKSVSPFSKLPSREQFSVNVSDVISFENLPNSTGKYETMRNVITKIRVTTAKSLSEK